MEPILLTALYRYWQGEAAGDSTVGHVSIGFCLLESAAGVDMRE